MIRVRPLLREPLLHFLVLGATLFALHAWVGGTDRGTGDDIVLTRGRIEQLAAGFARVRQREPDAQELDALIDDAIREEILYREARALGLDQDDTIVRRRLRQKIEFVSEDLASLPEPTDAELQAWRDAHSEAYRRETSYGLTQVYLDPQKRGSHMDREVADLLASLRDLRIEDRPGDPFLLPARYDRIGAAQLSRLFGEDFERSLRASAVGAWHGPVASGYGVHVVLLHAREEGGVPPVDDIRDALRTDWIAARRREANEAFYAGLRGRYDVTIERDGAVAAARVPTVPAISAQ